MAWEKRGNRRYYYQKRREGNRVVSEYVGRGRDAELIARLQEIQRDRAGTDKQVELLRRTETEEPDREVGQLCNLIQALTEMILTANGYHKHNGEWRREREK